MHEESDEREENGDPESQLMQLSVNFPPEQLGGVWANFARVSHSPHEFTIDFIRIDFATAPELMGVVVARVGLSPLFVTQLIETLKRNWDKYAERSMPREVFGGDEPGAGGPEEGGPRPTGQP
jgi:hypothetical protein